MLGQELGDHAGRHARGGKAAADVHAGRDDGGLDRVQHVEALGQRAEAMPVLVGMQHPVLGGWIAGFGQVVGAPDLEPPVVAVLLIDLAHGAAEVERLADALLHQRGAPRRLHHGRGHVAAGNDRVLWAGAGVHQVGLVKQVLVQLDLLRVLHQHLGSLRDAGEQFVRALRGVDHGCLRTRAVLAHRVELAIKVVEGCVRQPSLVEMQGIDVAIKLVLDRLGVVEHAVVGALSQGHDGRLDGRRGRHA